MGNRLFIILAGKASLTCTDVRGQEQVVETLGRGDLFGVITLFSGKPSPASVVATDDLEVIALRADAINQMLEGRRSLAREIGQLIEGRRKAIEAARNPGTLPAATP
ncbi:MAG: cyclic nucleotide-binding domain-containing protein [Rhodothermales bacterium]